jgi:hypothetical protein
MDPSTEYSKNMTKTSSDFSPHEISRLRKKKKSHESKRLSQRAGTRLQGKITGVLPPTEGRRKGSWESKRKPYRKEYVGGKLVSTNIHTGKDPKSGRPIKRTMGGFGSKEKNYGEESEY